MIRHQLSSTFAKSMRTNETKRNGQSPSFANQLTTVQDLLNFKKALLTEIKEFISAHITQPVKRWLKSFKLKEKRYYHKSIAECP